jgi:uncharacterized tellurite resistance protein B-like protein
MSKWEDQWTLTHDIALLFVALAFGTDRELSDDEVDVIMRLLRTWRPEASDESIRTIIVEVMSILVDAPAPDRVQQSIDALGRELDEGELSRVLEHVNQIAAADGILLQQEEDLLGTIAEAWSLRGLEAPGSEDGDWDLIHQMSLIYVVVAHSTDDELSAQEIATIIDRVCQWDASLNDEEARDILRDVLAFYAQEPGEDVLGQTIMTIKNSLEPMRRLILLDDLYQIAHADGAFKENERNMITSLAEAWGISVRLNGNHSSS